MAPRFNPLSSLGTVGTSWSIAGSGDFNGDGNADILWQNTVTGQRGIWLMNGTTFQSFVDLGTVGTSWSIAGSGDFNGDGKADILWQNTVTGQRGIWLMNGTTFQSFVEFGNGRDIVEHRWFGRLQRGRQGGHSLAKHRYRPARNLAHEWHHVSILCRFRNGRYIVAHQKLLTDSAINRHCFDPLRIVFPQLNQSIHRITTPSGTPTNTTRQPASPHGSRAVASSTSQGLFLAVPQTQTSTTMLNQITSYACEHARTAAWYMNNNVFAGRPDSSAQLECNRMWRISMATATLITSFQSQHAPDGDRYLSGGALVSGLFGPTLPSGWALVATPDFNGDCKPDYVLYRANPAKLRWYMDNNMLVRVFRLAGS